MLNQQHNDILFKSSTDLKDIEEIRGKVTKEYATGSSSTTEDTTSGSKAFSCAGKVIGGYYADVQEKCQMFHVCTIGENGEIRDIVFRCLNGTVFDQETRVCEREEEVNCAVAQSFFHLNNDLYGPGIIPETAPKTDLDNSDHDSITNINNNSNRTTTPLIITRTASSTSVSASARVHIQTPLSRFSYRQGTDPSHTPLPAPHLRPSLLKLAAQSMSKAKERKRSRRHKRATKENDSNNSIITISNEHNTNRLSSSRHPFLPISVLYNLLSFILKPQVLQPSTFTLNNQQVYGSDIFEPRFRNALKHALGQTHRQITVLKSDKETPTRDANPLCSGITNAASLVVEVESGCQFLHLCLPQQNQGYAVQTFVCDGTNYKFDPITKLCTKEKSLQCNTVQSSTFSSFREAQFFSKS
ncbi:hypothetical protein Avbf_16241 [Armadillidium vulgare]|nr:hypothetical protein Avbf_16241 [Armadillidium vulgare]